MSDADRELRAEATVAAPPERVWALLTDLSRMPDWSPELVRMVPLKRGGLRVGQWYLGLNRRKAVVWPTRNVVAVLEPGPDAAWDTTSSGARWIWELEPDGDGHPRRAPASGPAAADPARPGRSRRSPSAGTRGTPTSSRPGMAQTVARLKAAAEA